MGAEIIEAAIRLSRILSSSTSMICASRSASKSFDEICPKLSEDVSLFTGMELIMPWRDGVGVEIMDDPIPNA